MLSVDQDYIADTVFDVVFDILDFDPFVSVAFFCMTLTAVLCIFLSFCIMWVFNHLCILLSRVRLHPEVKLIQSDPF